MIMLSCTVAIMDNYDQCSQYDHSFIYSVPHEVIILGKA